MSDEYVPSGATKARLGWLSEQLETLREEDPERYKAMAEGMHIALGAIRQACDSIRPDPCGRAAAVTDGA